jgi:tRNA nucleotidyltransferase (CCA-adding enzyme)
LIAVGLARRGSEADYYRGPVTQRLPPPRDAAEARERLLAIRIPVPIMAVLETLDRAGFHGVVVGGAVRDALLGEPGGDWDVASNATPAEVVALFPKTIPTGIEHGTVTVLTGRGDDRHAVELTTFRGEGEYHDGRRPSEVRFLRELIEDLARRDLTINAFAWDPVNAVFTDAFGGLADLQAGLIRAVGDAVTRFAEDGLRTMRAIRFAATMGFSLAPETEAAIAGALAVFDKVSRERVRVELVKLLAASRPSLGLVPMARTGLWDRVLAPLTDPVRSETIAAVDRIGLQGRFQGGPRPMLRLARLLWPVRHERAQLEHTLDQLKLSREERTRVLRLTELTVDELGEAAKLTDESAGASAGVCVRKLVAELDRAYLEDALDLLELDPDARARIDAALVGAALTGKELAIKGRDLIEAKLATPGTQLGDLLEGLLDWVIEDPSRNTPEQLLAEASTRA